MPSALIFSIRGAATTLSMSAWKASYSGVYGSACTPIRRGSFAVTPDACKCWKPRHVPSNAPPCPMGETYQSGTRRPNCSQISQADVICPNKNAGCHAWDAYLMDLTMRLAAAAALAAASRGPGTSTSSAP